LWRFVYSPFLKDDFEKDVKIKILNNLFRNIDDFKIDKFISSNPNEYRLRAKFKIFDSKIGYYKFGTHEFVKIDQCPVVKSSIFEKASQVARSFRTEKITEMSIIENEKGEELIYVDTEDDLPIKDGFNIKTKHQQIGVDKIYIKQVISISPQHMGVFPNKQVYFRGFSTGSGFKIC